MTPQPQTRQATLTRTTRETSIDVTVKLDAGSDPARNLSTGIGFLDHMLDQLSRHSNIAMDVKANGDRHIDDHHTVEDVGIALGETVRTALGDKRGIVRYAQAYLPMDEALTRVAIDVSGRPFLVFNCTFHTDKIGTFDTQLVREFFTAFAMNARLTLHVETLYGTNDHHIAESVFKGVARALGAAVAQTGDTTVPSTKGVL